MAGPAPRGELVATFSEPGAGALDWADALAVLETAEMFWLSTVRSSGRPHVTPLPAVWLDGALHFCTGAEEQKAKNLEQNHRAVLTTGTNRYRSGVDVVVEGDVVRVTDAELLGRLAALWKQKLDWEFAVRDGLFVDPSAGNAAVVFALRPSKILAFSKAPYSQTRFEPTVSA